MTEEQEQNIPFEKHYITRKNWLRAAVLGANDGILSIASIAVGVAAANVTRDSLILTSVAGLVGGALSMAAGEYVSVSSQTDVETADIEREKKELENIPEIEMRELAKIYVARGLTPETADEVARQMTEHDALEAHIRDELGITDDTAANPAQASLASGAAFVVGGGLPFIITLIAPLQNMVVSLYLSTILFLILLGITSARMGGSSIKKAVLRITLLGTIAMGITALIGYIFGVSV